MRARILTTAGAVALAAAASLSGATGASAASTGETSPVSATMYDAPQPTMLGGFHLKRMANGYSEIILNFNDTWCITEYQTFVYGAPLVLGTCANADSQHFFLYLTDNRDFIESGSDGECITVPGANGQPDGKIAEMGFCTTPIDVSQTFGGEATGQLVLPLIHDSNGNQLALDNKGNVLRAYNPIDTSYACGTCHSENWYGPNEGFGGS